MQIWKLTPLDLADPSWEASTHKADVVVRAPSEQAARGAAKLALRTMVARPPIGAEIPVCPWTYEAKVSAEVLTESDWPADGEVEILDPPYHNDALEGFSAEDLEKL